jgi:hypothetical protein
MVVHINEETREVLHVEQGVVLGKNGEDSSADCVRNEEVLRRVNSLYTKLKKLDRSINMSPQQNPF